MLNKFHLKSDVVLGHHALELFPLLKKNNGKCKCTIATFRLFVCVCVCVCVERERELYAINKMLYTSVHYLTLFPLTVENVSHKVELSAEVKGSVHKVGDLYITLNGMHVDMLDSNTNSPRLTNGVANGMNTILT